MAAVTAPIATLPTATRAWCLRDQIKPGDLVFIYHSSTDPTGIAGIAEVVRGGYPDQSAFDSTDSHFDPKSKRVDYQFN